MEQQELLRREMKINLSINQQQQKEDVKIKRGDSASDGVKEQELIGMYLFTAETTSNRRSTEMYL